MSDPDLRFWFDPVCPFAWLTSRWVRSVQRQRDYSVEWRLISLRLLNSHIDYDSHFPEGYEDGHNAGLHLLRVCAAARAEHGAEVLADLYPAISSRIFDADPSEQSLRPERGREVLADALADAGLFPGFAEMKRSLRELPQLRALGVAEDEVGRTEDWHGGSRRLKK